MSVSSDMDTFISDSGGSSPDAKALTTGGQSQVHADVCASVSSRNAKGPEDGSGEAVDPRRQGGSSQKGQKIAVLLV